MVQLIYTLRKLGNNSIPRIKADFLKEFQITENDFENATDLTFEQFIRLGAFSDLFTVEGENIVFKISRLKRRFTPNQDEEQNQHIQNEPDETSERREEPNEEYYSSNVND
uniref:Uncharacterized protein n=1 Tax=Strongyloides papillosus TaxID=174720 RepID=A0A0N5BER3_STREA